MTQQHPPRRQFLRAVATAAGATAAALPSCLTTGAATAGLLSVPIVAPFPLADWAKTLTGMTARPMAIKPVEAPVEMNVRMRDIWVSFLPGV